MPSLLTLNELRREAISMKGRGGGETGHTSADHQELPDPCHVPSDRDGVAINFRRWEEASPMKTADLGPDGTLTWTKVNSCANINRWPRLERTIAR